MSCPRRKKARNRRQTHFSGWKKFRTWCNNSSVEHINLSFANGRVTIGNCGRACNLPWTRNSLSKYLLWLHPSPAYICSRFTGSPLSLSLFLFLFLSLSFSLSLSLSFFLSLSFSLFLWSVSFSFSPLFLWSASFSFSPLFLSAESFSFFPLSLRMYLSPTFSPILSSFLWLNQQS